MIATPQTWLLLGMGHHNRQGSPEGPKVLQREIQAEQRKVGSLQESRKQQQQPGAAGVTGALNVEQTGNNFIIKLRQRVSWLMGPILVSPSIEDKWTGLTHGRTLCPSPFCLLHQYTWRHIHVALNKSMSKALCLLLFQQAITKWLLRKSTYSEGKVNRCFQC